MNNLLFRIILGIFLVGLGPWSVAAQVDTCSMEGFYDPENQRLGDWLDESFPLVQKDPEQREEYGRRLGAILDACPERPCEEAERNGLLYRKFTSQEEYLSYTEYAGSQREVHPLWNTCAQAAWQMGWLLISVGELDLASQVFLRGLELDPDHPDILAELGYISSEYYKRTEVPQWLEISSEFYTRILTGRPWSSARQRARALRGLGYLAITRGDLDQAEGFYLRSLELEESKLARQQLEYIAENRKE
jgi:tetratricopeptide (TPR) repeat protein